MESRETKSQNLKSWKEIQDASEIPTSSQKNGLTTVEKMHK